MRHGTRYFNNGKTYCDEYRGGGYTDWRMPTIDELKTIYNHDLQNKHGYHVTKLIDITSEWIWAKEGWWDGEAALNFRSGSTAGGGYYASGGYTGYYGNTRALPVRAGK